ncbi:transcriptional repressor [Flammeovirga sp. SubArs3]|uniref:Fur family transcriptional regulator n=1 Tax=Flammeovirga sp. SubArs3 TaxID=2995316 RepID=UPI00248B38C3|nr:transcriptional repressor [Flammeovirga sp. SubArs3]
MENYFIKDNNVEFIEGVNDELLMKKFSSKKEYLCNYGIRSTPFRTELLEIFMNNSYGLTHKDLQQKIKSNPDKATIYRALDIFLEKGVIHKVPGFNSVSKYALTQEEVSCHTENHAHFLCKRCKKTFCMNDLALPEYSKVNGFNITSARLVLEGICPSCVENEVVVG